MATTALTLQSTVREGLNLSTVAAASGDGNVFNNEGQDVILFVNNGGGSPITVSVDTPGTFDGLAIPAKTVSVTNGQSRYIGPFPKAYNQNDADNSIPAAVKVTYSAVTSVTVAAIRVGSLVMP